MLVGAGPATLRAPAVFAAEDLAAVTTNAPEPSTATATEAVLAATTPPPVRAPRSWQPHVLVGLISLPRPVEIEAGVRLHDTISLGMKYSMLPALTAGNGAASLQLDATQAVFHWFPFHGKFYVGSGLGYQRLKASFQEDVDGGELRVLADMSTFFVAPQIGWLWVWPSGFSLGINVGVQVPFPKDADITTTYNGQPLAAGAGSARVAGLAAKDSDKVKSTASVAMKYPLPDLDLLKIGFFF
jgi:hypothetical protein